MATATTRTLRNNRSGEVVNTTLSNEEALAVFNQTHGHNDEHWLWYWIHKLAAERSRGQATGEAMAFLGDIFVYAIGQGLTRPMLRLHYKDQRFKWYLSQRGTLCLKTGGLSGPAEDGHRDPVGDERYIGCLLRGRFLARKDGSREYKLNETEQEFLDNLAADPVGFIAQCGKDMARCCYCNQPLEDPRSKEVGYGKICAGRWGLPWGSPEYMEKAPSFSKVHNMGAAGLCQAIRANPDDEFNWLVFADWLEDKGLPRCKMPRRGVTMPREDGANGTSNRPASQPTPATSVPLTATTPVEVTPPVVSTGILQWTAASRTFSGYASDMNLPPGTFPTHLTLRSQWANNLMTFERQGMVKDREGEVVEVIYTNTPESLILTVLNG
jgi:uncharacterized protein (TIGR02996 family)